MNLNYEQIALTNHLCLFFTNPECFIEPFSISGIIQYNVKSKLLTPEEPANLEILLNHELEIYSHIYTIDSLGYIGIFFYREARICTMSSFCIKKNENLILMQKALKNFINNIKSTSLN